MAIIQFSDDPRTEFKLNAYKTKETLLEAIQQIAYKGGNTKTGEKGHNCDADFVPASLCKAFSLSKCGEALEQVAQIGDRWPLPGKHSRSGWTGL